MITVDDIEMELLPYDETVKYLGRVITFSDSSALEVEHRMGSAWRRFMSLKDELTNRRYSLNDRLKLFDSVVKATALYGCAAWTLTKELEAQSRTAQRRMLRMIVGCKRRLCTRDGGDTEIEPWHVWCQRATAEAERQVEKLGLESWVATCRRRKFRWAGRLASSDNETWAFRTLMREPPSAKRMQRRPRRRWLDDITEFVVAKGYSIPWHVLACNTELWHKLEEEFV